MSEKTRIAALKASLEMRVMADGPAGILERARVFNDWLMAGASDPAPEAGASETPAAPADPETQASPAGNAGTPVPGSADEGESAG